MRILGLKCGLKLHKKRFKFELSPHCNKVYLRAIHASLIQTISINSVLRIEFHDESSTNYDKEFSKTLLLPQYIINS